MPGMTVGKLATIWPELEGLRPEIAEQIEIDALYSGYLVRQDADIRVYRADEALDLPADLDYLALTSLSSEIRQKLATARPATLGQAARISGVTPAALTILLRYVRRRAA
jgi:tRNA uridine 5-carboxymethylaminomethyl modification enzyme